MIKGSTSRYGITRLVHFEQVDDMRSAITREKQLKKWRRAWKIEPIETRNPEWDDLAQTLLGFAPLHSPPSFPRKRESTDTTRS